MHRTIKFRAWTGKQMIYQDKQYLASFIRRVVMQVMLDHGSDEPREHETYLPKGKVIDDYLMLWTGFTDRKKQDVYDGDVLGNEWGKYRVFWDRGGFVVQSEDGFRHNLGDMDIQALEVIGNVYEGIALNLTWAKEALEQNGTPVTAANLAEITGQQVNKWQAEKWLASQSQEPEEGSSR